MSQYQLKHAFVLVTKWPIKYKSKTRLSKSIGAELATTFSLNLLMDLLIYYGSNKEINRIKFILFAPKKCQPLFENLLKKLNLSHIWNLLPMQNDDIMTSDLGDKFASCMTDIRKNYPFVINERIMFVASDCIELKSSHINYNYNDKDAFIIQSEDGGYVCLDLPYNAPIEVFSNVIWSSNKTSQSQINAISKCGIKTIKSSNVISDIDELHDWIRVCNLFKEQEYQLTFPNVYLYITQKQQIYLKDICGTNTINPTIHPKWNWPQWINYLGWFPIVYFLIFMLLIPICLISIFCCIYDIVKNNVDINQKMKESDANE
eukprot:214862_1